MPTSLKVFVPLLLLALGGCNRDTPVPIEAHLPAKHTHAAKHGGVAVELGEEEFHVEFTYGDTPGVIQAYFLDAEMEDYVRIASASFAAMAQIEGRDVPVLFLATASSATGETAGDTALFTAIVDGLTTRQALKLTVPTLTVKGRSYAAITADLPAGKNH